MLGYLLDIYETEKKVAPANLNALLDFFQGKYVHGEIDIRHYKDIYKYLHKEGAVSSHEHPSSTVC